MTDWNLFRNVWIMALLLELKENDEFDCRLMSFRLTMKSMK